MALLAAAAVCTVAVAGPASANPQTQAEPSLPPSLVQEPRVLVFARAETFVHKSIPTAVATIHELGEANGFAVDDTIDPEAFTRDNLARYSAVVFAVTTGDVLDPPQQRELRRFMRRGGGYVGIHSAADTEKEWPFYERLVGAIFKVHPLLQSEGLFTNEAPSNPAAQHIPPTLGVYDEHYSFRANPRPSVHVILSIDESTYSVDPNTSVLDGAPVSGMMGDHPMAWCHRNAGGPSFYTAVGHKPDLYAEEWYRMHLLGGIRIAMGTAKANCRPPV